MALEEYDPEQHGESKFTGSYVVESTFMPISKISTDTNDDIANRSLPLVPESTKRMNECPQKNTLEAVRYEDPVLWPQNERQLFKVPCKHRDFQGDSRICLIRKEEAGFKSDEKVPAAELAFVRCPVVNLQGTYREGARKVLVTLHVTMPAKNTQDQQ